MIPASDPEGDPAPAVVELSTEARDAWVKFYDAHNQELAGLTGDLAAAWSKLEGYAARFALVLAMVQQFVCGQQNPCGPIDQASIEAGATLSRWFAHEARRVLAVLAESQEDRALRNLTDLVRSIEGGQVSVRDWQRKRSHATRDEALAELEQLVDAGLGRWEHRPAGPKGGRPSTLFVLADPPTGKPPEGRLGDDAITCDPDAWCALPEEVFDGDRQVAP